MDDRWNKDGDKLEEDAAPPLFGQDELFGELELLRRAMYSARSNLACEELSAARSMLSDAHEQTLDIDHERPTHCILVGTSVSLVNAVVQAQEDVLSALNLLNQGKVQPTSDHLYGALAR